MTIPRRGKCDSCGRQRLVIYVNLNSKWCCPSCWDSYLYKLQAARS